MRQAVYYSKWEQAKIWDSKNTCVTVRCVSAKHFKQLIETIGKGIDQTQTVDRRK